jgi:hypothetical protein
MLTQIFLNVFGSFDYLCLIYISRTVHIYLWGTGVKVDGTRTHVVAYSTVHADMIPWLINFRLTMLTKIFKITMFATIRRKQKYGDD